MRDATASLATAQGSSTRTPYFKCSFTNDVDTFDCSSTNDGADRILAIDHHEEPYNGYATIVLSNSDHTVPDLRGFHVDIGYGDVTGSGDEYCDYFRLWVVAQSGYSFPTRDPKKASVYLVDIWGFLAWFEYYPGTTGDPNADGSVQGPPDYHFIYNRTDKVWDIMNDLPYVDMGDLVVDDGIINTFTPYFEINASPYEKIKDIVIRLISMTKCYLKQMAFSVMPQMKVVYPQETDSVDRSLTTSEYYFFQKGENEVLPNHIDVWYGATLNEEGELEWTDPQMGSATDEDSVARLISMAGGYMPQMYQAPYIENEGDADNRAAAILAHKQMEAYNHGAVVIPHDCRIELWDLIGVVDER